VWHALSRKATPPPAAALPVAVAPTAPTQPKPPDQETVFWESVRNSTSRVELEAYLAKYPNGTFAPLARARLAQLAAAAPPPERKPAPEPPRPAAPKPAAASAPASTVTSTPPRPPPAAAPAPVKPPPVAAAPPKPPPVPTRFDGTWDAKLACEAYGELPAGGPGFAAEVRGGEARINLGTAGQPGHLRLQGKVADDDALALAGVVISAARAAGGREAPANFTGRFNGRSYEGRGTLGPRKCGLTMARTG
jgi:hypothetical protein